MYLYASYKEDENAVLEALPADLMKLTGSLLKVMELELTPERKLARVDVNDVMASLEEKGYYLQYPPNDIYRSDDSLINNSSDGF